MDQRRSDEQFLGVALLRTVLAQRAHLVANRGNDEDQCDESEKADDVPQPSTRHPGCQLPELATEVHQ
jgi:hypothetical protein